MMVFSLAWRNARRNVQRTVITAGMVVLGTALLVVGMSWMFGLAGNMMQESADIVGHVRIVDPDYAMREQLMPLYENIPDAAPVVEAVRAVPGVASAWPVITAPVTVTAGEEIGDVFGLAVGADPGWFEEGMRLKTWLAEGEWFTGAEDEVIIGKVLAQRAGLVLGSEVRLIGMTQDGSISPILGRVIGIASAGNPMVDQKAYLPLARVEWLTDIPGGATEILIYTDDIDDSEALAESIAVLPQTEGLLVQAWLSREPYAGVVGIMNTVRGIVIGVITLLTALGVLNTMMMSVLERTHEIGVLRAMGLSRLGVVSLFVVESAAIAVLGGTVGVALGSVGGWLLETRGITLGDAVQEVETGFAVHTTLYGDLTFPIVVTGFVLGLVMALIGSLLPAIHAAQIEPVVAMRSGR